MTDTRTTRPGIPRHAVLRGLGVLAAAAALPRAARAGQDDAGHGAAATPATAAYMDAAARMHAAMDIAYTGDPDIDFARSMIPHHQGAIDMANVVREHGQDPELLQLADEVAAAQQAEIAFLTAWLERNA